MIILDGKAMTTREAAHDELAAKLSFPAYYGRNLDALFDLLTECDCEITLTDTEAMLAALGDYGRNILATFLDAAAKNPFISFNNL